MTANLSTVDEHPLDGLTSLARHFAWHARKRGIDFVRELLNEIASGPVPAELWLLTPEERNRIFTRETLEKAATELQSIGLKQLAKIVHEHAADRPRELGLCPHPPNTAGARAWLFRERQKVGLCPWCGSDKSPAMICDNGEPCLIRWRSVLARTPRPTINSSAKTVS